MSKADIGREFIEHVDFSSKVRERLANKGQAMPGGGFPIRNVADLKRAIQAYGRAKNKVAAKAWIIKRAKALGATELLPDDWKENAMGQSQSIEDFLEHYGVRGMKWGVRRSKRQLERAAKQRGGKSVKDMSDQELRDVVNRMNMEQQYARLSSGRGSNHNRSAVRAGAAFVGGIALNVARTQIQNSLTRSVGSAIQTASGGREGALIRTASAVSGIGRTERRR